MLFEEVLAKYKSQASSTKDQGDRFEKLMAHFLRTYQVYNQKFSRVWQWTDFPFKFEISGKDVGIDLVALTADGEFWAVQCKFYMEGTSVPKKAIDSFISTSGKIFTGPENKRVKFAQRLLIATTDNWSQEAANIIANQDPPFLRISYTDLVAAEVDWAKLDAGIYGAKARKAPKTPLEHQIEAIEAFHKHFKDHDRGKLILPCGTGKTFTALKIAEKETKGLGRVLFLAPSIALVGQTLREWTADTTVKILPICVCSDAEISKKLVYTEEDDNSLYGIENLALPASTKPEAIAKQLKDAQNNHPDRLCVIFSTYHSIEAVAAAISKVKGGFDLIVCDEAHRTTGVTLEDEEESHFVKIHNQKFIPSQKRLYMTATPRIYRDSVKERAKEVSAVLCSMDDETLFGDEVYYMGFSAAVEKKLLSDYKVLVLTLSQRNIPPKLWERIADCQSEINTDEATKFIGCIYALSKRMDVESGVLESIDPGTMRKAVAFCQTIKKSKRISQIFNEYKKDYYESLPPEQQNKLVSAVSEHVDGTMGASLREQKMNWLKTVSEDTNDCHILTNVRCLSEGVDVPSLDAVIFLSAKNSKIDVVQSVGRVMRRSPGKKFGYIIIPIVVLPGIEPHKALDDNKTYKVVWEVLTALKSHDDRFDARINQIRFNEKKPENIGGTVLIGGPSLGNEMSTSEATVTEGAMGATGAAGAMRATTGAAGAMGATERDLFTPLVNMDGYREAIYAKLVRKVGNQGDMLTWAEDVGQIAKGYMERIKRLVEVKGPHQDEFKKFLGDLQKNLNPSVNEEEVIRMLAQHMVTRPIFEALFENYSFAKNNPVSQSLETMVELLEAQSLEKDAESLQQFYDKSRKKISSLDNSKIKEFVSGIDNSSARQKIIVDLYDNLFKIAFKDDTDKLGIVYTPVELVDFIIHSVAKVLKREFNRNIDDKNVHILDPFTGTGTFITRLIQSGLLGRNLTYKYNYELHANEIVLLAYYISSINIENAYHDIIGQTDGYQAFNGICLTDTFQLYETDADKLKFDNIFRENSERAEAQKNAPIMVIIGNPPYSRNQKDANKNEKNQHYPVLDSCVRITYADNSVVTNKNPLYDPYIKAFRWSTDRLDKTNGGIIAFVSNAGWLDGSAMDGMRRSLEEEFSKIYVFNLRGNQRTSKELSRKEGGKIFGSGSRASIAITVLVKNPVHQGPADIYYHDIGDYLTREEKLKKITKSHDIYYEDMIWEKIEPNEAKDWINKRTQLYTDYILIGDKTDKNNNFTFFCPIYALGLNTNRDIWVYNFSKQNLQENMKKTIAFYNKQVKNFTLIPNQDKFNSIDNYIDLNPKYIKWSSSLSNLTKQGKQAKYTGNIIYSLYRPFNKLNLYFDTMMNHRVSKHPNIFPTVNHENIVICVSGIGVTNEFSTIITNILPDLELIGKSQCFPRYYYESVEPKQNTLFTQTEDGYVRHDGITDYILNECRTNYGQKVTKDQIFYYVYGLLHSQEYREIFSADLKKSLPRIPLVENPEDFESFFKAGKALAKLHLNYETVKPYSKVKITGLEKGNFNVDKIRFIDKNDKSAIQFNPFIKISGIPLETFGYIVNGRSAVEWIIDRYQVKVDKDSGIKNDPNDWAIEHDQPRYILDLILRVITVSLETMEIVHNLPKLIFD